MKIRGIASLEEGGQPAEDRKDEKKVEDKVVSGRQTLPVFGDTSRNLKLLFCFAGLQISYIAWGIVQEQLMTTE